MFPDKAIGITNLNIGGSFFDVEFVEGLVAVRVYPEPGDFDIDNENDAGDAVDAVNAELNAAINPVNYVGQKGGAADGNTSKYFIGYKYAPYNKVWATEGRFLIGDLGQPRYCRILQLPSAHLGPLHLRRYRGKDWRQRLQPRGRRSRAANQRRRNPAHYQKRPLLLCRPSGIRQ